MQNFDHSTTLTAFFGRSLDENLILQKANNEIVDKYMNTFKGTKLYFKGKFLCDKNNLTFQLCHVGDSDFYLLPLIPSFLLTTVKELRNVWPLHRLTPTRKEPEELVFLLPKSSFLKV